MKRNIILLLATLTITILLVIPAKIEKTENPTKQAINNSMTAPTPKEFLKNEMAKAGLTERDYLIVREIVQCESSWSQTWENDLNGHKKGEVKVSNGNIGLAQINHGAHHEEYEKLGLDPYNQFDNLTYAVILYKRNGVRDWEKWSGHCWKPALAKMGIFFGLEKLDGQPGGQCVAFIENLFKDWLSIGNAGDIKPNSDQPKIGALVLTSEGKSHHVALIQDIQGDELVLVESNYHLDEKITFGRRLKIDNQKIKGYFIFNKN